MASLLVTWVGVTDLRAAEGDRGAGLGPIVCGFLAAGLWGCTDGGAGGPDHAAGGSVGDAARAAGSSGGVTDASGVSPDASHALPPDGGDAPPPDGGDVAPPDGADEPECAPGCPTWWVGDARCDRSCDVEACGFDAGDCEPLVRGTTHMSCTCADGSWWGLCVRVPDCGAGPYNVCGAACAARGGVVDVGPCDPGALLCGMLPEPGPTTIQCIDPDSHAELVVTSTQACVDAEAAVSVCRSIAPAGLEATFDDDDARCMPTPGIARQVLGDPPAQGAHQVDCTCARSSVVGMCTEVRCGDNDEILALCARQCQGDHVVSSVCRPDAIECAHLWAVVRDRRTLCGCEDGWNVQGCAESCEGACERDCADHGGVRSASCSPAPDPVCAAPPLSPPPLGGDFLECDCSDGAVSTSCVDAPPCLGDSGPVTEACDRVCGRLGATTVGHTCRDEEFACVLLTAQAAD